MPTIDQNTEYVLKKIRANAGRRGEVTCVSVLVSSFLALIVMMTAPDVSAQSVAASQSDRRAQAPAVAVTSDGSVHVVWFDKGAVGEADRKGEKVKGTHHSHQAFADLHYARWLPAAAGFSDSVRVNPTPGQVWGFSISRPVIAADENDKIHILFPGNATSPESGKAVASSYYTRSTEEGGQFEPPIQLNADPEDDLSALIMGGLAQAQVFGGMAVSPKGVVHAFWLDTRGLTASMRSSLYYRRSDDGGRVFANEVRLRENEQCPCCQVSAVTDGEDSLYVALRQIQGDNIRTPMVMHSADGGNSFAPPVSTGGAPWQLEGCPLKLTAMTTTGSRIHSLVHNGAEQPPGLLYSHAPAPGQAFLPPQKIHPEAAISDSPAMASSGQTLLAVWHAKEEGPRQIFYRFSLNGGDTFLPLQRLDTGEASVGYPAVATAPDGRFVVAWQADEVIQVMYLEAPSEAVAGR
jgi:hypothetical protein